MADKIPTLVSPDGKREWTPEDAAEATNLRARGWSVKTEDKPAAKTATKS